MHLKSIGNGKGINMIAVKKPIEVEVWQLNPRKELPVWVDDAWRMKHVHYDMKSETWHVETLEGEMVAHNGDYLIKGVKGELYPCKKSIFEETYDIVRE